MPGTIKSKKLVKKKKPVKASKSGSKLVSKKKALKPKRTRVSVRRKRSLLPEVTRSVSHFSRTELYAYYSVGVLVMGIASFVFAYQTLRPNPQVQPLAKVESISSIQKSEQKSEVELPAHSPEKPVKSPTAEILTEEFRHASSLSLEDRIAYWSKIIEKESHVRESILRLGNGMTLADTSPLFSSEYDCTTFVETVAALARSHDSSQVVSNLLAIRYRDGKADFFNRNHFPEVDWIPNNQNSDILKDITIQLAQTGQITYGIQSKTIDKAKWLKSHHNYREVSRSLSSVKDPSWNSKVDVKIPFIDIQSLQKVVNQIPHGAVLNLVRENNERQPVLITHQGFVIRENGRVLFRHASRDGRIRTNDLITYLLSYAKRQKSGWQLVGVNLNQVYKSQ